MTGSDREKRWRSANRLDQRARPSRSLLVALLLACATVITLDVRAEEGRSPLDPARDAVAGVLGPAQAGVAATVRPFATVHTWFRTQDGLREEVARLESQNAALRRQLVTQNDDQRRLEQLEGLTRAASETGHALVAARVVGMGPAQSFSRTVTIDAGREAGIRADMTVLNDSGLVGRVLRAGRNSATVLLAVDRDSVVGARVGRTREVGFLQGRGSLGDPGRLDLDLLDGSVVPAKDDVVLTWGSRKGSPYVAGIPVGRVTDVYSTPRDTAQRAVIEPFVDFSSLDVVGVVVPAGTDGDRPVIEADGSVR